MASHFIEKTRIAILLVISALAHIQLIRCDEVIVTVEEGKHVHLDFNFSLPSTQLTFVLLRRNGTVIYEFKPEATNIMRSKSIELIPLGERARFTFGNVDTSDTGSYECLSSGVKQVPIYQLTVVPSIKEFTIRNGNGQSYQNNSVISVVEGAPLQLTCRFVGGLRSNWTIRWIIDNMRLPPDDERVTLSDFDKYHEESILEIVETEIAPDESWVRCEARGEQISVSLSIKRKPTLTSPATLTEGIPSDFTCLLNATASHPPTFRWTLNGHDVTSNSSQRPTGDIWCSTLNFYPLRSYFSKHLKCTIDPDVERFDSVVIEMNFPSTISSLIASPSAFTELQAIVNLSCQASGYPAPTLYWSRQSKRLEGPEDANWLVVKRDTTGRSLNKTTSEISLIIKDIKKEDIGRYRCIASNEHNSDEREIELQLEEYGILDINPIVLFENMPVNFTCLIKRRNAVVHIPWHIGGVDVTRNATQDEFTSNRGEAILRSILLFHPKREFNEMYLTCNGGREPTSPYSVYLNISYCEDNPVHNCFARENNSRVHLTCTTTSKATRDEVGFYRNSSKLDQRFVSTGNEEDGDYMVFYYDLGSTRDLLDAGLNCCTSLHRCPRYCANCEDHDFAMVKGKGESMLLLYILVAIAVVTMIIITLCFFLIRGKRQQKVPITKSDRIGVRTLQAVNAGESVQANLGSLPAIYEHMGTGYTTRVHSTSEYMEDDTFDSHNDAMDNVSFTTDFTEVSKISNFGTNTMTLNEKMSKLYGLHAGVETQEKEYASKLERSHFLKEIEAVKKLGHHPNIMEILGTIRNSKPNCIMFVKMTGTSLKQHLIKTRESLSDGSFEREDLRQYAEGVCRGMLFLSNNGFCHPSLRCGSVYLDESGACKLYDFTPVELCDIKDGYRQTIHELVAPEITRGQLHTSRTDVWAFGNLLWELYVYGLGSPLEDNTTRGYGQLIALQTQEKPTSCPDIFFRLMQLCWHDDPSSRPIFSAVLTELQDMRQKRKMSTTV